MEAKIAAAAGTWAQEAAAKAGEACVAGELVGDLGVDMHRTPRHTHTRTHTYAEGVGDGKGVVPRKVPLRRLRLQPLQSARRVKRRGEAEVS